MKALRVATGQPVAPWGDLPGALWVLDRPLCEVQERALADAGLELVDAPPVGEPFLVFSDRCWFTAELARRLRAGGPGRLWVQHEGWQTAMEALQELPSPGLYEIGVHPARAAADPWPQGFPALEPRALELGLKQQDMPGLHPALAFASRPVWSGAALVHQLDHWSHLLRLNLLALAARAEQAKLDWDRAPIWKKVGIALWFLLRVRPTSRWDVVAGLVEKGKGVSIHPTATVELSVVEEGAEIGPHAVVRGSWVGKGARVEEHSTMNLSVLGAGAKLGRYGMLNMCVVGPGAQVSWGNGYQATVVGREAFLAWGVTALDLSFGKHVKVEHRGQRADSGQHFLGVAIGHRAVVGHAARLNYGAAVPNDAFLIGPSDDLLRDWGDAPVGQPVRVGDGGRPQPVRRGGQPS